MRSRIPEHSGKRLASLNKDELIALLRLRVEDYIGNSLRGQYDCPPNRVDGIAGIVEVLNATSGVQSKSVYHDNIVDINIKFKT